jgi:predicted metalloprotease with PDZ domain
MILRVGHLSMFNNSVYKALGAALIVFAPGASSLGQQPIRIVADLTDHVRGVLHAHIQFPVKAGALTLGYPEWIPGEHAPTGPLNQIIHLSFHGNGKEIPWRRDLIEIYNFHLDVPAGVQTVDADLDFASVDMEDGFSATVAASDHVVVLNWWLLTLFPVDQPADQIQFQPSVKLPPGWSFGTALVPSQQRGDVTQFAPVSLRTLIDSPVLTAQYFKKVQIGGKQPVELDLGGESERSIAISAQETDHFRRLVAEAESLFGGAPYKNYHLLLCLSDPLAHYTLEHSASSDNRFVEDALYAPGKLVTTASTIPHEYVHAWNGKARIPDGLATLNYQQPLKGDLIWVYEGLTEYLGMVLTTRSGFWNEEEFREALALDAGEMATHPGRLWRSLEDTAVGAQLLTSAPTAWLTERRSTDFYAEGALIWMEVDTILRQRSGNKHSLDDFCKLFLAPAMQGAPKTYTLENVLALLNQVQAYDWRSFFADRLEKLHPKPPLGGITGAGWKFSYGPTAGSLVRGLETAHKTDLLWPLWSSQEIVDARFSIGLLLEADGTVLDVSRDMAGFQAGIAPGMRILSVNGIAFTPEVLRHGIGATAQGGKLVLIREHHGVRGTVNVVYHGGNRFPSLVRNSRGEDLLPAIIGPRTRDSASEGLGIR